MAEECPAILIKHSRGIDKLASIIRKPPQIYQRKKVSVLYGPTGWGKTRWVMENCPGYYEVPYTSKTATWFDNYFEEDTILFDELGNKKNQRPEFKFLLKVLDGRPIQAPQKGSFCWIDPCKAQHIVITSNHHPTQWYPDEDPAPLLRRITHLYKLVGKKKIVIEKEIEPEEESTDDAPYTYEHQPASSPTGALAFLEEAYNRSNRGEEWSSENQLSGFFG